MKSGYDYILTENKFNKPICERDSGADIVPGCHQNTISAQLEKINNVPVIVQIAFKYMDKM